MNVNIMSNVTRIGSFDLRTLYLDVFQVLCRLSEDLFLGESERSYQEVDIDKPYYTVYYDPILDCVFGRVTNQALNRTVSEDELAVLLDACGIGLLAWLTSDGLSGCDISYYVDPALLNVKVIRNAHRLDDMFPNLPESFIENIALAMYNNPTEGVIPAELRKGLAHPLPSVRNDVRLIYPIESVTVRSVANRNTVFPKVIRGHMGIPSVLPIAYYKYGHRADQHVKSSLYLLDKNGIETVVNLCEYVALLDLPLNWFTSVLYTLPPNLKQVVHVVHRPFISTNTTSSRGSVMHVYTC